MTGQGEGSSITPPRTRNTQADVHCNSKQTTRRNHSNFGNLLGLLRSIAKEGFPLLGDSLLATLASSLGLLSLGVHLLLEDTLAGLLGLGLVDLRKQSEFMSMTTRVYMSNTYVLNKGALVLESVTLGRVVKLVVEVLVDLAGSTVLDEQTTEDTHAAHPEDLRGHTGVGRTLALTDTGVATGGLGLVESTRARAGVHGIGLLDDESVRDQLADGLACRELSAG